MILATAAASIVLFFGALWLVGVVPIAGEVLTTTHRTAAIMRDPGLDERARETAVQRAAVRLLTDAASLLARGFVAIAASGIPIWLADVSGQARAGDVFRVLSGWEAAAMATALAAVVYVVRMPRWYTS